MSVARTHILNSTTRSFCSAGRKEISIGNVLNTLYDVQISYQLAKGKDQRGLCMYNNSAHSSRQEVVGEKTNQPEPSPTNSGSSQLPSTRTRKPRSCYCIPVELVAFCLHSKKRTYLHFLYKANNSSRDVSLHSLHHCRYFVSPTIQNVQCHT